MALPVAAGTAAVATLRVVGTAGEAAAVRAAQGAAGTALRAAQGAAGSTVRAAEAATTLGTPFALPRLGGADGTESAAFDPSPLSFLPSR